MACQAILLALEDAGLGVDELDGFAIYSYACDPAVVSSVLGVPEVRFAASLTSGGGGSAGSLGLAAAAISSGQAEVCVTLMTLQQATRRLGGSAVAGGGGSPYGGGGIAPSLAFFAGSGLLSPGNSFALLTLRHMELYGTRREHFAETPSSPPPSARAPALEGRLVAPRCTGCGTFLLPPQPVCFERGRSTASPW